MAAAGGSGGGKRGTGRNPTGRFERFRREPLVIDVPYDDDPPPRPTVYYDDTSRSILASNESPDIPFSYSVNPYRGCEHGCIYCYARPSHEYLGFSAGLDFESIIMVKRKAPELLDAALSRKSWTPQPVALSGVTDCYQPAERVLRLTRRCLEVFLAHRNPVQLITKSALILRDLDIVRAMAERRLIHVGLSITTLDSRLARQLEPRASVPTRRLEAMRTLSGAGVPTSLVVSPVIPGLTDEEIPALLAAAAQHGAENAAYTLVRLPGAVESLFVSWLHAAVPERAGKILHRIRETRDGALSDARYTRRMTGEGTIATMIHELFRIHSTKQGLAGESTHLDTSHFVRAPLAQGSLFEDA